MLSIRSAFLLAVTLSGLFMTACPGGGLFPKAKGPAVASAVPVAPAAPSAAPTPAPAVPGSIKGDWAAALEAAMSWGIGSALYEIEGQDIDASGQRDMTLSTDAWNFRFAAVSRPGQLLTVNISGTDKVVSQVIAGTAPYPTFKFTALGLDSPAAFRKAAVTGLDVRTNLFFDSRYGMVVYLFPGKNRLRLDAWTGEALN
ncbi:MAG: hypothetical protein H7338_07710 [Candidatus Sericytochromatia bacterium]|nr:hypothetical protein [Candidatus Sericytochromatia bacterium]